MTQLNPLRASSEVVKVYRDYLLSAFEFSDAEIQSNFERELDGRFTLGQGPFLQSTPPFKRSLSIRDLVAEGTLSTEFVKIDPQVQPLERPLYSHQVEALRKMSKGRNLIVATGTGSGKTESFLYPIVNSLLTERELGTLKNSGVRALLLYPMNALANDQMKRLRDVLKAFPDVTFGRYIGDTKRSRKEALEIHRARFGEEPPTNELLSREEMQERPPHILVTNFAMLEYLLLRPEDNRLFDSGLGSSWRFVVLDEVHTYQGAQGGEIAMLLRRVRDRVASSRLGVLQFIGTSATLGQGLADAPKICQFASDLFGERCEFVEADTQRQDLITPQIETLAQHPVLWRATFDELATLGASLEDENTLRQTVSLLAIQKKVDISLANNVAESLGMLLLAEEATSKLRGELAAAVRKIDYLAAEVLGDKGSAETVRQIIDLCAFARVPGEPFALMSARYHHLVRALEGLFYCFNPDHPDALPRLSLERRATCEGCSTEERVVPMFELGPCRLCGQHHLVGKRVDEGTHLRFGVAQEFEDNLEYLTFVVGPQNGVDEDEEALGIPADEERTAIVCVECGSFSETSNKCGHVDAQREVIVSIPREPRTPLRMCVKCGGRSNGSIVDRVQTGRDAPASIIAATLYQSLPESSDEGSQQLVGQGRKLLTFSDSRQDAAFFAPYLERTYSRNVQRSMVLDVLHEAGSALRFGELIEPIRRRAVNELIVDPRKSDGEHVAEIKNWLVREALATDRRQSLGGVGLVRIRPAAPRSARVPSGLDNLGLRADEAVELALFLLDTVREQGAVHLPDSVNINDPIFSPRNVVTYVRQQSSSGALGFAPKTVNRRSRFLAKVFENLGLTLDPIGVLDSLWSNEFANPQSEWSLLLPEAKERGVFVRRLDHQILEFEAESDTCPAYRCKRCNQVSWFSIREICTRINCDGNLERIESASPRKRGFKQTYFSTQPIGMRVEEHTGQLDNDYAASLQQSFVVGGVNVLSCSTTFELGVDLGEIQSVLLKNVPPSPANYVQRAGRAGRRLNSAALVTTFAQRRSHDLYFFNRPEALVNGSIPPPQISVSNERIARRHLHSIALAAYARKLVAAGNEWPTIVGRFFLASTPNGSSVADGFREWLESRPMELQAALLRVFPELDDELGINSWEWVVALYDDSPESELGWMHRATKEILDDFNYLKELIAEKQAEIQNLPMGDKKRIAISKRIQQLDRQFNTTHDKRLLDHLATRVVLPKYGFPVDVVSLDVWRSGDDGSGRLDLTRDLRMGILDFAPTSSTVAAKRLWESTGIRIPPAKTLPLRTPAICSECGTFRSQREGGPSTCPVCGSDEVKAGLGRKAVLPIFGFYGAASKEQPGDNRPPRVGSVSSYFSDFSGPSPEREPVVVGNSTLYVRLGKQGQITVLNRGPAGAGFRICTSCGFADVPKTATRRKSATSGPEPHPRPGAPGRDCTGSLHPRFLGHEFLTDTIEIAVPGLDNEDEAWSTLAALMAVAPKFGISQRDVSGTLRAAGAKGRERALVLFDAVPGGAGYSRGLRTVLPDLFAEAFVFVADCGCGEDTSCYGCLKTYENQSHHDQLSRAAAMRTFRSLGL